jgi:hypothetical protein
MKLKNFCTTKEMVSKLKRLPTEWEKIFASYILDKGLITRTYRELKKLNSSKKSMTQWRNEQMNWTEFFQRKKSKWLKTHEKMFTIPGHKGMQIKITLRFYLTPVRIATIKNTNNNKCWRGWGEKGIFKHCWWECKLV